jgi:uncharacterized protein (TIGR02996 family)
MTDLADGAALLQGILDAPDDGTLRLVYADWLEENGQAVCAGMVRDEVDAPWLAVRGGLWERQSERYPQAEGHAAVAVELLGDWPDGTEVAFRGGFVSMVRCSLDAWQRLGPALAKAHPIETLLLTDREPADQKPGSGVTGWRWFSAERGGDDYHVTLPGNVWRAVHDPLGGPDGWRFPTREAAYFALVTWARAQP